MLEICQIPVLSDNYIYLIHDSDENVTAVVDPAVADPVLDKLEQQKWHLDYILNTHHHSDHIGANLRLKELTGCSIIGAEKDKHRIPGIDKMVAEESRVFIGRHDATIIDLPGHTAAHIAFWFKDDALLFCGDTLFSLGCGRLFEGTPEQMWCSLLKIRQLPAQTKVYCAHEYTETNARFALSLEPDNQQLKELIQTIRERRSQGRPTIPSSLEIENQFNPFLRADNVDFQRLIGMENCNPIHVFAAIRQQKDNFH